MKRMQALRVAIVMHSPRQPPGWCMRLIEQIRAEPQFELSALLTAGAHARRPAGNRLIRIWTSLEKWLVPACRTADFNAESISDLPVLTADDAETIESLELDVILDLSPDRGSGYDPGMARHGLWFPDFLGQEPGFAGLGAIVSDEPVTRISLLRRNAGRAGYVRMATALLNTKFVAARNELFMCEKTVPLIMRELRRAHRFGSAEAPGDVAFAEPRQPGSLDLLKYLGQLFGHGMVRLGYRALEWLGLRPGMFFLKADSCRWHDFEPAKASAHVSAKNSYFADPFLWERDGTQYCFFEEYDYRTGRGHICVGKLGHDGLTEIRVALRTDYHLSFPFLFEHAGNLFMMPETSEVQRLEVWRCLEFPARWERYATAMEGVSASDSTLNLIDGEWWLFTNISRDSFIDMNTELHVFKADGPELRLLEPHSVNPVVLNSRQARNAGRVLSIGGKLYRPSQDNSHGRYGYGVRLMEIRRLSLDEYVEAAVLAIRPDFEAGIIGCHHLDIRSGHVVMDVRKRIGGLAA